MIPTVRLLYKLDMRLNKVATSESQSIPLEDKILALNEAQIKLIKKKLNNNNSLSQGLDASKKRYQDLQALVIPFEKMAVTKTTEQYDSYAASIDSLQEKYFVPLEMYASCTKEECKDRMLYIPSPVRHGDLITLMTNKNYAPSFEYEETLATISDNNIVVYTDGTFIVDNVYLTYLKYPQKIDIEGYEDFDGTPSVNSNTDLPEQLEDELLDVAYLELAIETENIPQVQMSQIRNQNSE